MKEKSLLKYFSTAEKIIWTVSVLMIISSFMLFDRTGFHTLIASLIGVTALIFCSKGNPAGQVLMIVFCTIYSLISLECRYYGEMLTYMGMSLPMCVFSLISWLRHPYKGNKAEVSVNRIKPTEFIIIAILTVIVTVAFYFILKVFGTASLLPSTFSVSTSFFASALVFRRSPYFALAYTANDVVLIVLWFLAARNDISYLSVIICFFAFLINDIYTFINWKRMQKKQACDM